MCTYAHLTSTHARLCTRMCSGEPGCAHVRNNIHLRATICTPAQLFNTSAHFAQWCVLVQSWCACVHNDVILWTIMRTRKQRCVHARNWCAHMHIMCWMMCAMMCTCSQWFAGIHYWCACMHTYVRTCSQLMCTRPHFVYNDVHMSTMVCTCVLLICICAQWSAYA